MIIPNLSFGLDDEQDVNCIWCNWIGKIKDCKQREVNSSPLSWRMLTGREGIEYLCPKCNFMVDAYYWRMS